MLLCKPDACAWQQQAAEVSRANMHPAPSTPVGKKDLCLACLSVACSLPQDERHACLTSLAVPGSLPVVCVCMCLYGWHDANK